MVESKKFESIDLSYNEDEKYINFEYLKSSKSDDFRAAWNAALKIQEDKNCKKWLLNQKKQSIHPEDQKWVETDWIERSMKATPFSEDDPRYVAIIQSENFFVEFSTKKFIKENSFPGFIINIFRNVDDGVKWLKEVD